VASPGPGLGTTFTVRLPLYRVPSPITQKSTTMISQAESAPTEDLRLRILVVDDTAINRRLLVRLLTNRGHFCDEAGDGREAIAQVVAAMDEGLRYDTILLDYQMPVMDGPTAAAKIRKLGCDSLIVGLTGNLLPEDVAFFQQNGADAVLPKPFNMDDLEHLWVEHLITASSAMKSE